MHFSSFEMIWRKPFNGSIHSLIHPFINNYCRFLCTHLLLSFLYIQVGPALNHKAIKADSNLTVLCKYAQANVLESLLFESLFILSLFTFIVKPKSISIVGHSNNSNVEIRRGEDLSLRCVVAGGKPAAQIKWFRKSVEFGAGKEYNIILMSELRPCSV